MNNMCDARATNGDSCDKGQNHEGPHVHFGSICTHAWGLHR